MTLTSANEIKGAVEGSIVAHYTSAKALVSIVERGQLYASDPRHLNDRVELEHGKNRILELLWEKAARGGIHADRVPDLTREIDSLFATTVPLVTCFSRCIDSLDQWRGYGGGSLSVALEFDENALRERALAQHFQLIECLYKEEDQRASAGDLVDSLAKSETPAQGGRLLPIEYIDYMVPGSNSVLQKLRCTAVGKKPDMTEGDAEILKRLNELGEYSLRHVKIFPPVAAFKHESFEHEKEVRAVIAMHESSNEFEFRTTNRTIIPFTYLNIGMQEGRTPLKRIRIGPDADFRENERAIRLLLTRFRYPRNIELVSSATTYRH